MAKALNKLVKTPFFMIFCCLCVVLPIAISLAAVSVPAGHVGVVALFGKVEKDILTSGLSFINPLATVTIMSVKTQIIEMNEEVPTKEGVTVHLEAAALIHLQPQSATKMFSSVGPDYLSTVVLPQFRSVLRSVTSAHDAKDLYTATTRESMTKALKDELTAILNVRGLVVEETPLKKIELPAKLHEAIEDKLRAEQDSQKMEFILAKERQEAARKTIEAQGIAEFQRIVSEDINENMLRWKGLEATELIAQSQNSKIILIGPGSKDGLPIILNPRDDLPSQQPSSPSLPKKLRE
eukprot:CAMPEP_0174251718 /NCGR_PEP_ID=MMETSP0439-20130205/1450_1 /TAXON_ID=0 /ORGANISM="Stereomyxa ramosa, Strain Chinc5" /LENGTH=294 /DNA_ID=CAMNT_0015332111 /DNA_START=93 /DNA_END=977 /DNA_ORIENTATION=-